MSWSERFPRKTNDGRVLVSTWVTVINTSKNSIGSVLIIKKHLLPELCLNDCVFTYSRIQVFSTTRRSIMLDEKSRPPNTDWNSYTGLSNTASCLTWCLSSNEPKAGVVADMDTDGAREARAQLYFVRPSDHLLRSFLDVKLRFIFFHPR